MAKTKRSISLKKPISKNMILARFALSYAVRFILVFLVAIGGLIWYQKFSYGLPRLSSCETVYLLGEYLFISCDLASLLSLVFPISIYFLYLSEKHAFVHIKPQALTLDQKRYINDRLENKTNNPVNHEIMDYCVAVKADGRELCHLDYWRIIHYCVQENEKGDHSEVDQKMSDLMKDKYEQKMLDNAIHAKEEQQDTLEF